MSANSIEVVIGDGAGPASPPEFLYAISRGGFTTPRGGFWREHDRVFHFPRLAALSGEDARLAMRSAHVGLQLYEDEKVELAVEVVGKLDGLLSVLGSHADERRFLWDLVDRFGVQDTLF